MAGLYGITTRAPGTLISGLIYNSDHQVHVDGRAAEFMQAHGTSLSQMNLQESPFGPDGMTETLPLSLAGELTRLRYVIAAVKTMLNGNVPILWWTPVDAPAFAVIGARMVRSATVAVADSSVVVLDFTGAATEFNSGVWSAGNPTRFTAPSAGLYYAAAAVHWASSTGGGRRQLSISTNVPGAVHASKTNTTAAGQQQSQTVAGLLKMAASDYVEFSVFQDSGVSVNLVGSSKASIVGSLVYFGVAA